jgi:hypothetical protein
VRNGPGGPYGDSILVSLSRRNPKPREEQLHRLPTLNFSASYYEQDNVSDATIPLDLIRQSSITLNLDHRQRGIGSGSCGPGVLPQYELPAEAFAFSVTLSPLQAGQPL